MKRDNIAARNRTNAKRSTGPKTATGKAVVAQNARKHGATVRPDPASLVPWVRVILDEPSLAIDDLMGDDPTIQAALDLAEAEAWVVKTTRALQDHLLGGRLRATVSNDIDDLLAAFFEESVGLRIAQGETREAFRVKVRVLASKIRENVPGSRRERLLRRYYREALGHRRRAFAAWIAVNDKARGEWGVGA